MIILADNDIVYKLACCDLLDSFLTWLDSPPAQVWVLPNIPFVLRKKLKNNSLALASLNNFLKQTQIIPEASMDLLMLFEQLDVGERQMLAVLVEEPSISRLVTGDKRALKQIADMLANHDLLAKRLAQTRTDCLESIMLGLIDLLGFSAVNAKASLGAESDLVLKMAFGPTRSETHARAALNSYVKDITKTATFVAK